MLIQLKDLKSIPAAEVKAELDAKEKEGNEGKLVIRDVVCHDISDEAAAWIAREYGMRNQPGRNYLWMLANGDPVGPEYVHDDIHNITVHELSDTDPGKPEVVRLLTLLRGWLYLKVSTAPREAIPQVPEEDRLRISSISVRDLIGRYVANRNGAEFKLTDIRYDLKLGRVTFELADLDEYGDVIPDSESGLFDLDTFTVL